MGIVLLLVDIVENVIRRLELLTDAWHSFRECKLWQLWRPFSIVTCMNGNTVCSKHIWQLDKYGWSLLRFWRKDWTLQAANYFWLFINHFQLWKQIHICLVMKCISYLAKISDSHLIWHSKQANDQQQAKKTMMIMTRLIAVRQSYLWSPLCQLSWLCYRQQQ